MGLVPEGNSKLPNTFYTHTRYYSPASDLSDDVTKLCLPVSGHKLTKTQEGS